MAREVEEELALDIAAGSLLLTDWLPPWSGWDDAVCLVFDGGTHAAELAERIVPQAREIRSARFCTMAEVHQLCADFTARRIDSALAASTARRRPTARAAARSEPAGGPQAVAGTGAAAGRWTENTDPPPSRGS